MPGCEIYSIRPLPKFEISLVKLVKTHYKKNKRARDSFETLIQKYIETLAKDPFFDESDSENFPKGAYKPDFEFRKIPFITNNNRKWHYELAQLLIKNELAI